MQTPVTQTCVAVQGVAEQPPQWFGSLCVSMHVPPQFVSPVGQPHEPLVQTPPTAHTLQLPLPAAPQAPGSVPGWQSPVESQQP